MRIAFAAGLVALCAIVVILSQTDANPMPPRTQGSTTIVLTDAGFVPAKVHVGAGSTITFSTTRNVPFWPASDPHPSHSMNRDFDPAHPIQPGESWSFTFEQAGEWEFHDHLRSYFTGIIYVSEL